MTPPFIAGQQARKNGKPITDNPHKPARFATEDYPGSHALYQAALPAA